MTDVDLRPPVTPAPVNAHDTARSHWIRSSTEPGLSLHVRSHEADTDAPPVLFVHGATCGSRLYDIPVPGANWLKSCRDAGFNAYALDVRGYGLSHSAVMENQTAPYGRAAEIIHDIDDVVDWIRSRHGIDRIALVGGSWGSVTSSLFVSGPGRDKIDRLVLYAPIYAERNADWIDLLADPSDRQRLNPEFGAARLVTLEQTRQRWDSELPADAIETWRDEAVLRTLMQTCFADDPDSGRHDPPAYRAPNGTLVDLWSCFRGIPLVAPERITCPTLLIRGSADTTSTRGDALALFDLLGSHVKRYVEIAHGSHFASAERNGWQIFDETNAFLASASKSVR
ncbi:MAG: alpha/beta hydrolase [Pseudomonadota bacterium]